MNKFSYISNAEGSYIDELYASYKSNPESVDKSWQLFFEGFEFKNYGQDGAQLAPNAIDKEMLRKEIAVRELINGYRSRGHLLSKTNPIRPRLDRKARLDLQDFGLSEADLDTVFEAGEEIGIGPAPLRKIVEALQKIYVGTIGFDYAGIRDPEMLSWFRTKVEKEQLQVRFSTEEKKRILAKLNEAVVFENFLHTRYVGQKRFSLEGGESTIPALDAIIQYGSELGLEEIVIGMAHRGRLNVLANIMGKTYEQIFNEFDGQTIPDPTSGDGDVKYHMGYSSQVVTKAGKTITLNLIPNPSHLEAVNPVVLGNVRAKIDTIYKDSSKIVPLLIHGDAAVAGQGIVYETTQMANLRGYTVGGTIHFVINNQVGFTTDFTDARSSIYCTDLSQILEAPGLHVNGDDPEAVVYAIKLAVEFRQRYKSDIFIDMVCYRRHGHNESDEPKFTQPKLYNLIAKHPNPREIYLKKLIESGDISREEGEKLEKEFFQLLEDRLNMVRQKPLPYKPQKLEKQWEQLRKSRPEDFEHSPKTGVTLEKIERVAKAITTIPENFKPIKQIEKLLKDRKQMMEERKINWATAEHFAYGTLVLEGKTVRVSGQDVERGTFSHRHAVLNDAETNEKYYSLHHLDSKKNGAFYIYNSPLSEYGVLGFEYGYSLANPNALAVWEAQFGDFANGAQIIIDQFISSAESKWNRQSGLVMLLPHGYEGQGPEHSNARPERFLQLCAEYNMIVCNLTTPANFFHMLRRQLAWEFRKPCVLMSPKSMLRHPECISPLADFLGDTHFIEVYGDNSITSVRSVEKVLMCTGKVYYDLLEYRRKEKITDVPIIRIEQLHPFPEKRVNEELAKYPNLRKVVWVQEEPVNMGYWQFLMRSFTYKRNDVELVARKPSASPATGYPKVHAQEQQRIVEAAFRR
ncbi:MAG: 2-oxoglutarate dehydrogenase E1 component [Cytophagales bacterium]|nr:2-oxoglutarate dehydrogenase E1 component [Cytophagales bacterium]MDW8384559.1 2-oxoglutarate dehydrogenase E1 component [Flammeovirgaceae bacterium]